MVAWTKKGSTWTSDNGTNGHKRSNVDYRRFNKVQSVRKKVRIQHIFALSQVLNFNDWSHGQTWILIMVQMGIKGPMWIIYDVKKVQSVRNRFKFNTVLRRREFWKF